MNKKIKVSIIVPCFNEEHRIEKFFDYGYKVISKSCPGCEFILVNDGSSDGTLKVLRRIARKRKNIKVLSYEKNMGKGFALKKGVKEAQGEVIAFIDADFSISLKKFGTFVGMIDQGLDIVIGDRGSARDNANLSFPRRFLGKSLAVFNNYLLGLGKIYDTQCGFKFFKAKVAKTLFKELSVNRWLFDLEIILKAKQKGYIIKTVPVEWKQIENSKVNIRKDFFMVGIDLLKIYFKFLSFKNFLLIVTLAIFIIMLPFLKNPASLARRNGDYSDLVWPNYYFIKMSILRDHQIPLWNPTVFSGIPEISNPQSPEIYPPNYLSAVLPIDLSIVLLIIFHIYLAASFIFFLTKKIFKWSTFGVLTATFLFAFSPFVWTRVSVGHLSAFFADMLIPAILYYGIGFYKNEKTKNFLLLSLFLALQYLNYPTIWYYTVLFGGVSYFYFAVAERHFLKLVYLLLSLVTSLIFIAPIFLIQVETSSYITRSSLSLGDLSIPVWSFKRFLTSVLIPPNFVGDIDNEVWLYPGITGIVLAVLSFRKLGKKLKVLISIIFLAIFLITLGSKTPVFGLLAKYLPGFSYLRVSTRDWVVLISVIALFAGMAIEKLNYKWRRLLLVLVILDTFIFSLIRLWYVPSRMQQLVDSPVHSLLTESDQQYRYYCVERCISGSFSVPLGINTADGYHILIFKDYRQVLSSAGGFLPPDYTGNIPSFGNYDAQPNAQKLGQLAVKWVISQHELTDPNFVKDSENDGYKLYENKLALPRIRFAIQKNNKIEIQKLTADTIILRTLGKKDSLVLADNYFPGWTATVNDKRMPVEKFGGWAMSVDVPEGVNLVELDFRPFDNLLSNITNSKFFKF